MSDRCEECGVNQYQVDLDMYRMCDAIEEAKGLRSENESLKGMIKTGNDLIRGARICEKQSRARADKYEKLLFDKQEEIVKMIKYLDSDELLFYKMLAMFFRHGFEDMYVSDKEKERANELYKLLAIKLDRVDEFC